MAAVAPIAMPARVHHHHHHHRRALAASPAALAAAGNGLSATRRVRRSPAVEMRRERERRRAREQQPRCGEVAGGTAAECAAVFCCFPFAVVELVVLAAVRAPAALCRPRRPRWAPTPRPLHEAEGDGRHGHRLPEVAGRRGRQGQEGGRRFPGHAQGRTPR
ncbi:hypothetical protein OsJ_36910 [Oryza sativa Japonica Group]|uniref:Uncharacterized protein n=1 Tax=Oryza sativa subsp. japonica TaxID=39947 RepID=B9GEC6_ORYSJ|nr:hypothetical protein OsJ_36910 [Oryza sativa Japonica Group]